MFDQQFITFTLIISVKNGYFIYCDDYVNFEFPGCCSITNSFRIIDYFNLNLKSNDLLASLIKKITAASIRGRLIIR